MTNTTKSHFCLEKWTDGKVLVQAHHMTCCIHWGQRKWVGRKLLQGLETPSDIFSKCCHHSLHPWEATVIESPQQYIQETCMCATLNIILGNLSVHPNITQPWRMTVLKCFCSKAALFIIIHLLPSKVPTEGFIKHNMHNFKYNVWKRWENLLKTYPATLAEGYFQSWTGTNILFPLKSKRI